MNIPTKLTPDMDKLLESLKNGTHQWTESEKVLYNKVLASLPPDKAEQFKQAIPPPTN